MNYKKICLSFTALLFLPALIAAQDDEPVVKPPKTAEAHIGNLTGRSEAGEKVYQRYCWGCHGTRGDGNGENSAFLMPSPRNFITATFKCRSTPSGSLPLDSDLYDSITRGFTTTVMPAWSTLTAQNRADLVAYIKTFSARWVTQKPKPPIVIPPEPKVTRESIKRGDEVFQKLECWKCHGQDGRGDGPSANGLVDSSEQPIKPYNFYTGYRFKCGSTNADLYRTFMTGVDGTPMLSFAEFLKPEEAWDLVHYLRTLEVWHKSPELALWQSTEDGAAMIREKKLRQTATGNPVHP